MANMTLSALPQAEGEVLSLPDCKDILQRACFAHVALTLGGNVDVLAIRYAYVDNWVYFRAAPDMRDVIVHHPWVVLSVTEWLDPTHARSVVVRGACYATENTGSAADDATSMRGIVLLRDRAEIERPSEAYEDRVTTVYRVYAGEVSGRTVFVPCPAGDRAYSERELQRLHASARTQSVSDDERADDDGMADQGLQFSPVL